MGEHHAFLKELFRMFENTPIRQDKILMSDSVFNDILKGTAPEQEPEPEPEPPPKWGTAIFHRRYSSWSVACASTKVVLPPPR